MGHSASVTGEPSAGEKIVGDLFTTHPLNARAMADAVDTALAKVTAERDALKKLSEKLREIIRYWSYCTHSGMRRECPEKQGEFLEVCRELGIEPYAGASAHAATVSDDVLMDQWADRIG